MNINLTLIGQLLSFAIFVWFTMKYVWNDDHEAIHAAAETELRDLESSLLKSGQPAMASQVRNAIQDGKTRDLRIRLLWTGNADLDLSVVEPGDSVCSYKARLTSNGGMLIRQGEGGRGEAASGRQTEEYVCVVARSGEYQVRVRYISGRVINGKAIVQVIRHENTDRQQKQSVTLEVGERDAEVSVPLTRGRAADPKD